MPQWLRRCVVIAALLPLFVGTFYLSYWLRFEGELGTSQMARFWSAVAWVLAAKLLAFAWFRVYQGWGRFVTFYDLLTLVQASTGYLLAAVLAERLLVPGQPTPRSVYLLDWGTTIVAVGGLRAALRLCQENRWTLAKRGEYRSALIVGAGEAGAGLLRAIQANGRLAYRVVGFTDPDAGRVGSRVGGARVLGTLDATCRLAERHGATEVLIAGDTLRGKEVRALVDEAASRRIAVKVMPSYEQMLSGSVAVRPRPVAIEDLLAREPVHLEMDGLRQWIDGRTLLVTGSAGSIGSEICRQLLRFSPERLVVVDRSETGQFFLERELASLRGDVRLEVCLADVLDQSRMAALFSRWRPEIVFHAAAYKHVPLMESHPGEAVKNIAVATRRLADLALRFGAESFVMVSTDKAVNPTSVMGACKRAAELYVQSLAELDRCRFVTVRFGNVLDSAGSVVQVFRQQIAAGGPVTVTDPRIERFFMTIPEAASLVVQAGTVGNAGEILLLDMGEPVKIVDLAADMIRLSGLRAGEDIEIEFTGLRPGEKLYEELQLDGERSLPTRHPKIMVADHTPRELAAVLAALDRLEDLADGPAPAVLAELRQLVPEYQLTNERRVRRAA